MKLVSPPQTTQSQRIYALERAREADGERLDKIEPRLVGIETTLGEIHGLLVKARGFKWVMDGVFKYSGQIAITCGALYAGWKFFTGH